MICRYLNGQNVTFVGPGHGSVVQLQTEDWFVYHAWPFKKIGLEHPGRMLMLDKITWMNNLWPKIGIPSVDPQIKPKTL